jgi:hypothetical protein
MRLRCAYLRLLWKSDCAFATGVPPSSTETHARTTTTAAPLRDTRLAISMRCCVDKERTKSGVLQPLHTSVMMRAVNTCFNKSCSLQGAMDSSITTAEAFVGGSLGHHSSLMCKRASLPLIMALSHVCWAVLCNQQRVERQLWLHAGPSLLREGCAPWTEKLRVYGFDAHGSSCCTSLECMMTTTAR